MPSIQAQEIVNKIFSGNKDLSSEVDDAMKAVTADALEAKKKEIAGGWMKPETTEEPNETDHGTD
tara:strand:+ start:1363 stop:1557 length:195 start_codon:yes stop_codon:yes gene_type:complete